MLYLSPFVVRALYQVSAAFVEICVAVAEMYSHCSFALVYTRVKGSKKTGGFGEVKNKSTKKKYLGRDRDDADSDNDDAMTQNDSAADNVFMSGAELAAELQRQSALVDCSPEFTDAIASHLYR